MFKALYKAISLPYSFSEIQEASCPQPDIRIYISIFFRFVSVVVSEEMCLSYKTVRE